MPLRTFMTDLGRTGRSVPRPEALLRHDLASYRTERERAELAGISQRHDSGTIAAELGSAVLGLSHHPRA